MTRFASKVTLIHRRDQLRASKIMAKRVLEHPKIEVAWNTAIEGYVGESNLEGIKLKNVVTGEVKEVCLIIALSVVSSPGVHPCILQVPAAGLFMAIGHEPLTRGLEKTGIDMDPEGYVRVSHSHVHTNVEVRAS